jgi:hypothetical protein
VNTSSEFISPGLNELDLRTHPAHVSEHNQPADAISVMEKIRELRRRSRAGEEGFDALAIIAIDCRNDGTPVRLVTSAPAPQPGEIEHYESTIHRISQLYEQKFRDI